MHTLLCVPPPRAEFLFPPILLKSCNQIPLAFNVLFSRNSSSHCQTPWLGSLMWGSEPSLQWVDFCDISVLQFVSHPPCSYVIWFYYDCAPPMSHCGFSFVFGCGVSFLVISCFFLSMIVQQLVCDSSALTRGSESTSFFSAILNQSPNIFFYYVSCLFLL